MTKFAEIGEGTAIVYRITWAPEDWPIPDGPISDALWPSTYVVAMSAGEACDRISTNPFDIKHVEVCGPVVERVVKPTPYPAIHATMAMIDDLGGVIPRGTLVIVQDDEYE